MSTPKQSRRKTAPKKLEPIDWHEFANDAVLNGNMSTLYRRPPSEDPSAYASPEALVEIEKRVVRSVPTAALLDAAVETSTGQPTPENIPTVGGGPSGGVLPAEGLEQADSFVPTVGDYATVGDLNAGQELSTAAHRSDPVELALTDDDGIVRDVPPVVAGGEEPPACINHTGGFEHTEDLTQAVGNRPTVGLEVHTHTAEQSPIVESSSAVAIIPTVGTRPAAGLDKRRRVKPIRSVQDAITLAGRVLYNAMYGTPDGAASKTCTKGYRQLAAETRLDKDTVRDLISEFKTKGIVRQTGAYNPDTREAKTYEVLSNKAILQIWEDAGLRFVTVGRRRPIFCTPQGEVLTFIPTVGLRPGAATQ